MSVLENLNRAGFAQSQMASLGLGGVFTSKREKARRKAELLAKQKISRKQASMSYRDRLRAGARSVASTTQNNEMPGLAPDIEANNTIENISATPQDTSQVISNEVLDKSTTLDPMAQQPGLADPLTTAQPISQPQQPTYGVAGAAEAMFGTPMQRQVSMGSSLMKRACKYKK